MAQKKKKGKPPAPKDKKQRLTVSQIAFIIFSVALIFIFVVQLFARF